MNEKYLKWFRVVATAAIIIALSLMLFVTVGLVFDFTVDFWAKFGFGTVLQIILIALWLPEGKRSGNEDEGVVKTKNDAQSRMEFASKKEYYDRLSEFCDIATEENRHAWIVRKVARLGVNFDKWNDCETYRQNFPANTQKKIDKIVKRAEYAVKTIRDTSITALSNETELKYDPYDHTGSATGLRVTLKIVTSFVLSFISAVISFDNFAFDIAGLVDFAYWCVVVALTIIYSIRTGKELITKDYKGYLLRICDFVNRYEAWLRKNGYYHD